MLSNAVNTVPVPLSASTFVIAAVSVVLPWSMWPIVPTLTWGLLRSNVFFAMGVPLRFLYSRVVGVVSWITDRGRG